MTVTRSDGRVVRFAVTRVREVAKAQFPTAAVYAPTPRPELRLITCGGRFDRAARSYVNAKNPFGPVSITRKQVAVTVQRRLPVTGSHVRLRFTPRVVHGALALPLV